MDIDAFAEALLALGYARKTIAVYGVALRRAAAELDLDTVGAAELSAYADRLPRTRSSRALLRSALRAYWSVTERTHAPLGAVRVPTHPRMRSRALEERRAAKLARAAAARGDRKGLAVLFGLYAGLRRAEIAALRWSDVDGDGWVTLVGKGLVTASLPLHPVLVDALRAFRRSSLTGARRPEGPPGNDWIFPGADKSGPVHPTTIWTWVRRVAGEAGIGWVPTHVLRHTALTTALDTTRDLRAVQELARHARPETTAGYTRVHRRRLLEVVAAISYEGFE